MKFSIFTPTHKPDFLAEAFASLLAQTYADWEWVIVPNQGAEIPSEIAEHPQVFVVRAPLELKGIGALKRFACGHCEGDYLVELDHDDLLTDNALACIADYAERTGAGFLYSDFSNFRADGSCEVFSEYYGWEHYPFHYQERDYTAMRSFDIDAGSLSQIFFAPNHIRVWERSVYWSVGGHDASMSVCDDHDLLCRTYLAGVRFEHIPECLYLYRLQADGQNTYLQRNAEIQALQQSVSNRYHYELIAEWCRRSNLPMLDLGGAHNKPNGFLSVDLVNADIECDIRKGLPFADNSVGCIRAHDFLEHIPHCPDSTCTHNSPSCVVGLMNELYRVLVPGGWLITSTPSTDGRGAFQDPTHVSFWNPNSFWYYTRSEQASYLRGSLSRFQLNRAWQTYPSEWHKAHDILYMRADLVALKGQRQAGKSEI